MDALRAKRARLAAAVCEELAERLPDAHGGSTCLHRSVCGTIRTQSPDADEQRAACFRSMKPLEKAAGRFWGVFIDSFSEHFEKYVAALGGIAAAGLGLVLQLGLQMN